LGVGDLQFSKKAKRQNPIKSTSRFPAGGKTQFAIMCVALSMHALVDEDIIVIKL